VLKEQTREYHHCPRDLGISESLHASKHHDGSLALTSEDTLGKRWNRTILNSALIDSSNFRALVSLARIH